MKRIIVAALAVTSLISAGPAVAASRDAAALKRELGPGVRVAGHEATGQVRFVGAGDGRAIPTGLSASASPREAARAFLTRHGTAFGIDDQAEELRVESSHAAGEGRASVRFQQLREGIPVVGGELVVNLDRERNVLSATGELEPGSVDRTPRVSAAAARREAVAAVAKERGVSAVRLHATTPSLAIYDAQLLGGPGPRQPTLVWRLEVKGDSGLAVDDLVLIDAAYGSMAVRIEQIEQGLNREVCDADSSAGALPCTPAAAARSEGEGPTGIADVDLAYDHAADVYDFYADSFGRDSLDDAGMTLFNTVRYCPAGCPFDNAFWNGSQMVYGAGWPAGDDAVGHELTHGVTDFSAHLFYYYQSGAINESMSDVFGELVDLGNGTGEDTATTRWQIFEDVPTGPFRDMREPAGILQAGLPSPDRMTSPNYFSAEGDQGGVHFNSGVNNKAAYLMTDGDAFNGSTVTGIGPVKVARIYYDVLTTLLTSGSDYADLASALPQACDDLVGGPEGITAANCIEVRDAVAAVEMSTDPPSAPAPHAPAAVCPNGQIRTDLLRDDMESSTNWTTSDTSRWGFTNAYAHSGDISLFGADGSGASDSNVAMTAGVTLPQGATSAYLRFDHAFEFEDNSSGTGFDGGVLEISRNGGSFQDIGSLLTDVGYNGAITTGSGNPLAGRPAFIQESHGYQASRATLTSLAGESVRFRWRIGTDVDTAGRGWFVDDVHVYSCSPPPDADGDGVPDASDTCPTTPATTPNGCPATAPGGGSGSGGGTTTGGTTTGGTTTGGTTTGTTPIAGTPAGSTPAPTAPRLRAVRVSSCKLSGRGKSARVRCTLRSFAAVRRASVIVTLRGRTVARKTVRPTSRGVLSLKPLRTLRRATYKVTIALRDAQGRTATLTKTLRVR